MSDVIIYRKNVEEALFHLSDYDSQVNSWFENDKGLMSSFGDDVEAVFQDTGLEYALNKGEIIFDKLTDESLLSLNSEVERVGYDRSEEELIDSPEMDIIRAKAAKALALVQASDASESTVEIRERPGE